MCSLYIHQPAFIEKPVMGKTMEEEREASAVFPARSPRSEGLIPPEDPQAAGSLAYIPQLHLIPQ